MMSNGGPDELEGKGFNNLTDILQSSLEHLNVVAKNSAGITVEGGAQVPTASSTHLIVSSSPSAGYILDERLGNEPRVSLEASATDKTAGIDAEDQAGPAIVAQSKLHASTTVEVSGPRPVNMSNDAFKDYANSFGGCKNNDEFFIQLAKAMKQMREKKFKDPTPAKQKFTPEGIILGRLQDNAENMHNLIDFVRRGVMREMQSGESNVSEPELQKRLQAVEQINNLAMGQEALLKNKALYDEEYMLKRIQQIEAAVKDATSTDEEAAEKVRKACEKAYSDNEYNKRISRHWYDMDKYGSTKFSAIDAGVFNPKHTKRGYGKVFHIGDNEVVVKSGILSRKSLYDIGHGFSASGKFTSIQNRKFPNMLKSDILEDLEKDMRLNVATMIAEYDKGSKNNPVDITYLWADGSSGGNLEPPKQPVEAMQMLMEFKRLAMLEGKTFYANRDGKAPIAITPDAKLSKDERALFKSFADEKGTVYKGYSLKTSKKTAAEIMFKEDPRYQMHKGDTDAILDAMVDKLSSANDRQLEKTQLNDISVGSLLPKGKKRERDTDDATLDAENKEPKRRRLS